MFYIEYDGKGHNLSVISGEILQEDFDIKEIKRKRILQSQGWELIRIVSNYDWLPSDEVIFNLIQECKDYLFNENHSWIEIHIDTNKIKSSKLNRVIELGELRKIKKENI